MKHTWNLLEDRERTKLPLFQFPSLLITTLRQKLGMDQIVKGFRRACIFPLDREAIKTQRAAREEIVQPPKKEAGSAMVAWTSLRDFLSKEKLDCFEAVLEGNASLSKSDESLFGYFFHLKQLLAGQEIADFHDSSKELSVTAQTGTTKIKTELLEYKEDIVKREPEDYEYDIKVENTFS